MAESSGELLGGRFRLLGERTSFPFGSWWEAEDEQGVRTLVLRMHAEVTDPAAKATQAMAQSASIDSPHIVAWTDGGTDSKGHGWLAAPMFGPWSLHEHVSRTEGIPPGDAASLMHQLARGMAAAEAVGAHHNCLASELVRLVALPEGGHGVKIYGYGLAELMPPYKPLRKQDSFLGVPDYMSPELCGGKTADGFSADIYAAGVLMYESVRGRPPFAPTFASASASTTLKRHIFEKPLPLSVRYANAAHIKSYETICFKALSKTANRRQLTLAELEKELEQLLVEEMRHQVVNLGAMSARGPTTARRLRTQVLPQVSEGVVAVEVAPSVVVAPEPEPQPVAAQAAAAATVATVTAAPTAGASPAPEAEKEGEKPRRAESTMVFAGLGPAVRELAVEAAKKADEEEEEDDGEGEAQEGGKPAPAAAANQGPGRGKKGKKKRGSVSMPAAQTAMATAPTASAPRPEGTPPSDKAVPATAAASADAQARVRRKDEKTAVNPAEQSTVIVSAVSPADAARDAVAKQSAGGKPAGKAGDEQEDWFATSGVGDGPKKKSKAWIFLAVAAAIVLVVVIILVATSKSTKTTMAPAPAEPTRYALSQVQKTEPEATPVPTATVAAPVPPPATTAPAPATTAPAQPTPQPATGAPEMKPVETAPVEMKPVETKPIEMKPIETKPIETKPIETKPIETKPVETKPVETKPVTTKPVETKPIETKPVTTKPVETRPIEIKPAETKPVETKPVETKPAEVKPPPTESTPPTAADDFREQAKHYMSLGLKAYKAENYKLAAGYFQKAQEADGTNALAAKYLQMAREKMGQ